MSYKSFTNTLVRRLINVFNIDRSLRNGGRKKIKNNVKPML